MITLTDDGLIIRRAGSDRVVSWDGQFWEAQYLSGGSWVNYPKTPNLDPTGGELLAEGRAVLRRLAPTLPQVHHAR